MNSVLLTSTMGILLVCLSSACSFIGNSVGYYSQSILGHTRLMLARQPVSAVMTTADQSLREQLLVTQEIREFAIGDLSLPDNNSYTHYVAIKGDAPVWNVVAAEEFSLQPKQWCYLVIGCASYRGYYRQQSAEVYAEKIRAKGYEAVVLGAAAYSTLGWFADPLTSVMLDRDQADLAELIFHELAHQQLYVNNHSRFNEAFATVVGEQGALRWLSVSQRQQALERYQTLMRVRNDFMALVNNTKRQLQGLYQSDKSVADKRQAKQAIFAQMRRGHQWLVENKWNNKRWYAAWFNQPINNARLAAIGTYRDLVPDFLGLFERCGKNFSRFYQAVAEVAARPEMNLSVDCITP